MYLTICAMVIFFETHPPEASLSDTSSKSLSLISSADISGRSDSFLGFSAIFFAFHLKRYAVGGLERYVGALFTDKIVVVVLNVRIFGRNAARGDASGDILDTRLEGHHLDVRTHRVSALLNHISVFFLV